VGGTVPSQALPGVCRAVGSIEPLRNTLAGSRAILYFCFGARGDAGLTHAVVFIALELLFWAAIGLGAAAASGLLCRGARDAVSCTAGWSLNEFADRPITSLGPSPSGLDRWITFT
jgi:hypothetical protein